MNFDEIHAIGESAFRVELKTPGRGLIAGLIAADRSRTRAIVEALRDEMLNGIALHTQPIDYDDAAAWFNEILGCNADGEEVGGLLGQQVADAAKAIAPTSATTSIAVRGVSRLCDNPSCLMISLSGIPSDEHIRSLHDAMRKWSPQDEG